MIDHEVMNALKGDASINETIDRISKTVMAEIKKEFSDPKDEYMIMLITTLLETVELTGQLIQAHGLDAEAVMNGPTQQILMCLMHVSGYDKDRMIALAKAAEKLRAAVRAGVQERGQMLIAEQERGSTTVH